MHPGERRQAGIMQRYSVSLGAVLAGLWLLLSGHYSALLLGFGAASCLLVLWLARRMGAVDAETQPLYLMRHLPGYWLWLMVQIARSNIDVIRRVVRGRDAISPTMETVQVSGRTELAQTILANSITLTPGTVSVDARRNTITVHAISAEGAADLNGGEMDQRVRSLETREPGYRR